MRSTLLTVAALATLVAGPIRAQAEARLASPRGEAATQVAGTWNKDDRGRPRYDGGKWVAIDYGRPVLRQRADIFGSGDAYGKQVYAGAPVWRAGANQSTRLSTEVPLTIGGQRLEAGEYSLFIALEGPDKWTLIVSNWKAQDRYDPNNKEALWGAYGYTADKDVLRAPMKVQKLETSIDQLTWGFSDVTAEGGTMNLWWDGQSGSVAFQVAK